MDCKPNIQPGGHHPFGSSSSNRLNLNSNVTSAYSNGKPPFCFGCKRAILDRFLLQTMGTLWHEDCLKCKICECRLGEVGSSLFTRREMLLCKRDYFRLFGERGLCAICKQRIPSFELVMKARGNNYHLDCFACQTCKNRFCVGDRFYLHDDKILCEFCERTPTSQMGNCGNASNLRGSTNTPNHISSTQ